MSTSASSTPVLLDGVRADLLAAELQLPAIHYHQTLGSTLDVAHDLASQGSKAGTLVIADEQTAGRGRLGRRWTSLPGAGLWLTLVERISTLPAFDVLSLRVGLYVAEVLDGMSDAPVTVKWPNDLQVHDRKLGGILIETRWRGAAPEWVAIGFGLNVIDPGVHTSTGLAKGASRLGALRAVVPAIRSAAAATGYLSPGELARFATRDALFGRHVVEPAEGVADGISAAGELRVRSGENIVAVRSGSVSLARSD